jgi:hypothetical protein
MDFSTFLASARTARRALKPTDISPTRQSRVFLSLKYLLQNIHIEKAAMIPIRRCVLGGLGKCTLKADVCLPRSQPVCHGHCRFPITF